MQKYAWDPMLYNNRHSFVAKYGEALIPLLDPRPGEKILDLACGTATLTNQISSSGAKVFGIDRSETMIKQARIDYPHLELLIGDAHSFKFEWQFDAIFSNAALHWMLEPEKVLQCVWSALKPGGRFVFEMGGKGNTKIIEDACEYAISKLGYPVPPPINFFPSISEYSTMLERQGFIITYAHYFERPTPLVGIEGLRNWIRMLRNNFLINLNLEEQDSFFKFAEEYAKPKLMNQNGEWIADYVRLRMVAKKPNA